MSAADPPSMSSPTDGTVSLLGLVVAFTRHFRLLLLGAIIGAGLALAWSFIVREQYTATTIFAPGDQATPQLPGGLAALGSAFGSTLSLGEGTRSLQFYSEVLKSHDLLSAIASDSFRVPEAPGTRQPLSVLMRQGGDTPARVLDNTVTFLQKRAVSTSVNDRTGMISLTVAMPGAELAAAVANRLYARLEAFNFAMRRSGATSRREFAERELANARGNLDGTEAAMRDFLERNRGGLDTPRLALQREQLQRRIDVAQIAYRQMTQELVEARIAEARDTPIFTVVQQAAPPMDRTYPQRKRMIALGGVVGGCLVALGIALRANAGRARALDPASFAALRNAVLWHRR